jgi:hypothetical protein
MSLTGSLTVVTTGTEFQVNANGVKFGNVIGDAHNITGSVGISGSLSSTSATFTAAITPLVLRGTNVATMWTEYYYNTSTLSGYIGSGDGLLSGANASDFIVRSQADFVVATGNNRRMTIASSTGAATFSSTNLTLQSTSYSEVRSLSTSTGDYANLIVDTNNVVNYRTQIVGFGTTAAGTLAGIDRAGNGFLVKSGGTLAVGTREAHPLVLSTNETERMTITSDGNQINYGNIFLNQSSVATVNANATSIGINGIYYMNRGSGSGLSHVILGNGGNVIGSISSNTTNAQFNTSSDYRLKKDLKDFNALDVLSNIKLYDFAWKLNDSRMYGVMAHELKEILPYAVIGEKDELDENGDIKSQGVDYSLLTPVLAKAIQELQAQITELKNK